MKDFAPVLFERGITAVLSGDEEDYLDVLKKWERYDFEPVMGELLQGLYEYQQGNHERSLEILGKAYVNHKDNRSIAAAYLVALHTDKKDVDKVEKLKQVLLKDTEWDEHAPTEDIYQRTSNFLYGCALIYEDHHKAEEILKSTLEGRPWPIARVMYSCALSQVALDDRDAVKAWKAVEEIQIAERYLGDGPLVLNIGLWARYHFYFLTDDDKKRVIKAEIDKLAATLEENINYKNNYHLVANWYKNTNNPRLTKIYEENLGGWQGALRSAHFYEIGNDKEATIYLDEGSKSNYYARHASASVAAANGKHNQAMEVFEQVMRDSNTLHIKLNALDILLLLGDYQKAAVEAEKLNKPDEWKRIWPKVELRLDLIADCQLPTNILAKKYNQKINKSGSAEMFGNYTLGLIALAKDDTPSAKAFFEKVIQSKQFYNFQYAMAQAFLARLFNSIDDEK